MAKVEIVKTTNFRNNIIMFLVWAGLAYLFASIAIDRGLIWYAPFFGFLYLAVKKAIDLAKKR